MAGQAMQKWRATISKLLFRAAKVVVFLVVFLIVFAFVFDRYLRGTAVELPLKTLLGMGEVHIHRVKSEIDVNGVSFPGGIAFRSRSNGYKNYLIYFRSGENEGHYTLLNFYPEEKVVAISMNANERSVSLIADRILLRSDVTFPVVPFGFDIKSEMASTELQVLDDGTFAFEAMPDCSEMKVPLPPAECLVEAKKEGDWYGWGSLPFGNWRVRFLEE